MRALQSSTYARKSMSVVILFTKKSQKNFQDAILLAILIKIDIHLLTVSKLIETSHFNALLYVICHM